MLLDKSYETKVMKPPLKACNRILLVDDDPMVLQLIQEQVIEISGDYYVMDTASSVEHVKNLIESYEYFVALIDLELRGTWDGLDLIKYVRDRRKCMIVVCFTGHSAKVHDHHIFESADDVLIKPYTTDDLRTKLFVWNVKYRRRMKQAEFIDERIYTFHLDTIRRLEDEVTSALKALGKTDGKDIV